MDKKLILNKLQEYYRFKKDIDFADFLGISGQVLSKWKTRNTYDIELIYTKCTEISPEWLITGKGSMLKSEEKSRLNQNITGNSNIQSGNDTSVTGDNSQQVKELQKQLKERDKEIERLKTQVDKLFKMIP